MNHIIIIIILIVVTFGCLSGNVNAECKDLYGRIVNDGIIFMPENSCVICECHNSEPKYCNTLPCYPPKACKSFTVGSGCCKLECLDELLNKYKIQYEDADNVNKSVASRYCNGILHLFYFYPIVFVLANITFFG